MSIKYKDKNLTDSQALKLLLERVDTHDKCFEVIEKRFEGVSKRLTGIDDNLTSLNAKAYKSGLDLDYIKEQVQSVPKIYNLMDKISGGFRVDRDERVILKDRVDNHEERLVTVEVALSISPPQRGLLL